MDIDVRRNLITGHVFCWFRAVMHDVQNTGYAEGESICEMYGCRGDELPMFWWKSSEVWIGNFRCYNEGLPMFMPWCSQAFPASLQVLIHCVWLFGEDCAGWGTAWVEIGRCHSRTPFRHSSQNPSPFPSIDGCHSHTPFRSFPQNPPPFPAIVPCLSRPFLCRARIVLSAIPVLSACFIGTSISGQPLSFCTYRHDYFEILSKKPVGYDKNAVSLLGKEGRKTKIDVLSAASFSFPALFINAEKTVRFPWFTKIPATFFRDTNQQMWSFCLMLVCEINSWQVL